MYSPYMYMHVHVHVQVSTTCTARRIIMTIIHMHKAYNICMAHLGEHQHIESVEKTQGEWLWLLVPAGLSIHSYFSLTTGT